MGKQLKLNLDLSFGDRMVVGLIPPEEQERIFNKLLDYYKKLYPGLEFTKKEAVLSHKEIGDIQYTYSGEETEATAAEKMRMISSAVKGSYSTPIVIQRTSSICFLIVHIFSSRGMISTMATMVALECTNLMAWFDIMLSAITSLRMSCTQG